VTVVLAAAGHRETEVDAAVAAVRRLVAGGAPRRLAADVVSELAHAPRNALYRASLDPAD
jgi:hypothetical protein